MVQAEPQVNLLAEDGIHVQMDLDMVTSRHVTRGSLDSPAGHQTTSGTASAEVVEKGAQEPLPLGPHAQGMRARTMPGRRW